jgi:hypothetical protein
MGVCELNLSGLGQGSVAGYCEQGNGRPNTIKGVTYLVEKALPPWS